MAIQASVIIPTYNRSELLLRCLDALTNQSYSHEAYEIIIVIDGEDYGTIHKVNQYLHRRSTMPEIHCFSLGQNKGPAAARNAGWLRAKGELILFTDDDCIPSGDWVSAYTKALSETPEKKIAFTGKVVVPQSKKPTDFERNTRHLETAEFVTANCACTKKALQAVEGFDETFTMAWREDSELEFKLIKQKIPIKRITEAVVIHPARPAVWGVSLKEQKKSMFNALLYKKHPDLYRRKISDGPQWSYYLMIASLLISVSAWLNQVPLLAFIAFLAWLLQVLIFSAKRLKGASHSISHILEMIVTSAIIPFLSVYWTLYGAFRFKTLYL